jgi:hypothetical protein
MSTSRELTHISDRDSEPISLRALLGPPPLIQGEEAGGYDELLARITGTLRPADILEEIWSRDVVDLVWDAFRLRRLKANVLKAAACEGVESLLRPVFRNDIYEIARNRAARDEAAVESVDAALASAGLSMDAVMARTLTLRIDEVERIDRLVTSAEAGRSSVLRELDRHRASFAQNLRRAIEVVEDAEFKLIAPEKTSDREAV